MSARVALAKMAADGLIILPAPTGPQPVPRRHLEATIEEGPMLACSLGELGSVSLVRVDTRSDSATWNELIGRFHYLGYTRASGAQLRYLAISNGLQLLDHLGLGRDFGLERLTVTHERRVTGLAHEVGLPSPRSLVRKFRESG